MGPLPVGTAHGRRVVSNALLMRATGWRTFAHGEMYVFLFESSKSSDLNENCLLKFSGIEFPQRFIEYLSSYYLRHAGRGEFH